MLVAYKDTDTPYPVGIAVAQWNIDGDLRTYIIYPIRKGDEGYVEVEVATDSEQLLTVKPATKNWQSLDDDFGDESEGYPCNEEMEQDLYDVWDDGVVHHPEAARRLFKQYRPLIDNYAKDAVGYMTKSVEQEYTLGVQEAKDKGWDTALISQSELRSFPYES